jgi:hypothetical protein
MRRKSRKLALLIALSALWVDIGVASAGPVREMRFVGQSTARIIRVTSPVCRGAHVSDRTSIPG